MMRRQGFTLIELLVVVTIIAILAGGAVPYVQDYVEQSRVGRAKADLDEIKRAIMLYESQYGAYTSDTVASLVGPFLVKITPDPWGSAYMVSNASSTVCSLGPDGKVGTGDEIIVDYRPRMAVTRVFYLDVNADGLVGPGDALHIHVCRPASAVALTNSGLTVPDAGGSVLSTSGVWVNDKTASFTFVQTIDSAFRPGSSTLSIAAGNVLCDQNSNSPASAARPDIVKILYQ